MEVDEDTFFIDTSDALDSWTLDSDGNIIDVIEYGWVRIINSQSQ